MDETTETGVHAIDTGAQAVSKRFLCTDRSVLDDSFISSAVVPVKKGTAVGFSLYPGQGTALSMNWLLSKYASPAQTRDTANRIREQLGNIIKELQLLSSAVGAIATVVEQAASRQSDGAETAK